LESSRSGGATPPLGDRYRMTHELSGHARFSPSASHRWLNCPGSIMFCEQLPPELHEQDNFFADEGTAAHFVLEKCLTRDFPAQHYFGKHVRVRRDEHGMSDVGFVKNPADDTFPVDEGMVEAVQVAIDYVHEEMERLG